ncbi:MAG TPA: non-canonical purine NTP pyrophosphatase [Gemmatimonadaceae bacterium]|nr:non-canonical purine NTP pyrophosphatase [Gemmatimonadaceae bacterium]
MSRPLPRGTLLLGTRSAGKLRELGPLFAGAGVRVVGLEEAGIAHSPAEDEVETFETFEENALAKARYYHRLSGLPAIADDSGLAVDALGGRPGVHSKRWSGRADLHGAALDAANNEALLLALDGASDCRARYVCVAALVDSGAERTWRGETTGHVVTTARGTEGFGYDPYFVSDELGVSFGEAGLEAKSRVSHRGRAFAGLIAWLKEAGFVGSVDLPHRAG